MDQNTAQRFDVNELKHITEIDWNNEEHRRCIVAGLVKATYDLESDPPHVALITGINFLHLPNAAKRYLHYTSYFFKAGAGKFLASSHRKEMETLFDLLSPWVPNMYLHNKDWICQGFIDYFQLRQLFLERFSHVGRRSMMLSYRDMFFALLRKEKERPHLMPSAMLWMSAQSELHPHGLQQWWKPNEEIGLGAGTRYSYPSSTIPET